MYNTKALIYYQEPQASLDNILLHYYIYKYIIHPGIGVNGELSIFLSIWLKQEQRCINVIGLNYAAIINNLKIA